MSDPHTHKKEEEISLRYFDSGTHTQQQRETDCSSHITCVFRGVCDDEEVARPKRKAEEAWVCDTADDLFKDAALVCMTLSLSSTADDERRACFLCRRRRERFFSFHLVLLLIIKVVPFCPIHSVFFFIFTVVVVFFFASRERENFCV